MTDMENTPDKFKVYGLHKSFGISVLTLVIIRLMWKAVNTAPLLPDTLRRFEKLLAHIGHAILYALLFAMPLSGWALSSASGFPVSVFGQFTLPDFVAPDNDAKHTYAEIHELLAYTLIVMIVLHVLAALLHHYYYKDNVLRRMLPFTKEGSHASSDRTTGC
jgi:cytochrome b561